MLDFETAAGLLHDFGQLILATWYPDQYPRVIQETLKKESTLYELEKQYFGLDHCEVGMLLAEQWNFPPELCVALRYHHRPELSNSQLAWILFAADIMYEASNNTDKDFNETYVKLLEIICTHLSLSLTNCADISDSALGKAKAFASAF